VIVFGADPAAFIASKMGQPLCEPWAAIGWQRSAAVVAAIGFTCWDGDDIRITVASDKGQMNRSLFRAAGVYVFAQIGCVRATIITENPDVADFAQRLGAEPEGMSRNQFGIGRDGYRLAFHRDGWRY
jgi:hypothetical protein